MPKKKQDSKKKEVRLKMLEGVKEKSILDNEEKGGSQADHGDPRKKI